MLKRERAAKLLSKGFSIIPLRGKVPIGDWKLFQTTPHTKETLPEAENYGIVTGYNGLEVIDVDTKVLPTSLERTEFITNFLSFLNDNIDDFYKKVVIYKTQSGGYHLLYRTNIIEGNQKLAKLKGYNEAIIETRGKGGQVVMYDDNRNLSYEDIQLIEDDERNIIISISKDYNYVKHEETKETKQTYKQLEENKQDVKTYVDFNNKHTGLEIIDDEFTIVRHLPDKTLIKRHGSQAYHSGYYYKDSKCIYLFSTGTIYPHETLLTPFALYAYKHYNGDFKKAHWDLYDKGYGTRIEHEKIETLTKEVNIDNENINFPLDVFPEEIANYILEYNNKINTNIDYMACSFLWLLSVIVGNSTKIKIKNGYIDCGTLWICLVGKAGVGKTPSINAITRPFEKANNNEIRRYQEQYEKFLKFLELPKEEKAKYEVEKPKKTQFLVNDITLEALIELHEENKNAVGVLKDELAGWFKDMNKYREGSDLEFWLSSWSNKDYSLNRKTAKNNYVQSPLVPVLGGIQPSILNQFYTIENKDSGFLDRILLCYPEDVIDYYNENEMDFEILKWYDDTIIRLFDFVKANLIRLEQGSIVPLEIPLSKEANKEWIRIYNKITDMQNDDSENEYMKSMLPKQKTYIPRFALLLNFLYYSFYGEANPFNEISKKSILSAEKISDYFINMAKKIKINSLEVHEIKKTSDMFRNKTPEFQFQQAYKINPQLNKSEAAALFQVSRQTIYKWIKNIEKDGK